MQQPGLRPAPGLFLASCQLGYKLPLLVMQKQAQEDPPIVARSRMTSDADLSHRRRIQPKGKAPPAVPCLLVFLSNPYATLSKQSKSA
jgi:hypothetical protein